jgi:hypothetical protein
MSEIKEYRKKTTDKIEDSQLTEDEPKTFSEHEEIFGDPKNDHPEEAFEISDQISSEDPEDSEEFESPDTRFARKYHAITTKDSTLKDVYEGEESTVDDSE